MVHNTKKFVSLVITKLQLSKHFDILVFYNYMDSDIYIFSTVAMYQNMQLFTNCIQDYTQKQNTVSVAENIWA